MGMRVARTGAGVCESTGHQLALAFIHHDVLMHWCKSECILLGARPMLVRERFSLPLQKEFKEGIRSFLKVYYSET